MTNTDLLSGDPQTQASTPASAAVTENTGNASNTSADAAAERADAPVGTTEEAAKQPRRRTGGLSGMVIAELRELATELGVSDTTGMRKGDLIAAIRERQGKTKRRQDDEQAPGAADESAAEPAGQSETAEQAGNGSQDDVQAGAAQQDSTGARGKQGSKPAQQAEAQAKTGKQQAEQQQAGQQTDEGGRSGSRRRRGGANRGGGSAGSNGDGGQRATESSPGSSGSGGEARQGDRQQGDRQQGDRQQNDRQQGGRGQQDDRQQGDRQQGGRNQQDDDGGGRRGRRHRDRRRRGGGRPEGGGPDTEIRDDDVLLPVAGILDVLDNYAFVRTSGYLAGPNDVYVSLSHVRKYSLRRGDAITGVVRQPREGEQQRQKFNPLVRVDTVNGLDPEVAKKRTEFTKLTPLYPNERLRLETDPNKLTTRVVDLAMPVGKGQRALIVSPPKAGKTTILQEIANAITTNNPECHLMVVLVDERPEEVTDMERSVNGEVIAATFDRPPSDHTTLAELAIERAKRLVEMGHDVVVLLDSVTRLGRAYNLAAPASGRILSGGVDSTALYPPKRFLGAARNIEEGGSLTIFATALVETGSAGDSVIFEEFKGTGNAELKLERKIAEKRTFPAVDMNASGTRKEELLLAPDELAVTHKLHRVLHALDSQQAIDLLLDRLRKSKTNIEFLTQVAKTAPGEE